MSARLSVPSYVLPGTYLENLRFIDGTGAVGNVELLFFMYDDDTRSLMRAEIAGIASYATRFGFTVHMPDTVAPEHEEILEATASFASAFVIHPPREDAGIPGFVRLLDEWRGRYGADAFLLENTVLGRFEPAEAALASSTFGPPRLCADVGHLRAEGVDPAPWIATRADRIAELHVHGYDGAKDHTIFSEGERWIADLEPFARSFEGVIEVELFSWPEVQPALEILGRAWGVR
ncbi:MAG: AP endonuclease [Spirochaetales bacterium]|nr:AP endonuclease [Spirochaetales bacterium]